MIKDRDLVEPHKITDNILFFKNFEKKLSSLNKDNTISTQRSAFDRALGRLSRTRGGGKVLLSMRTSTYYLLEINKALVDLSSSDCGRLLQEICHLNPQYL